MTTLPDELNISEAIQSTLTLTDRLWIMMNDHQNPVFLKLFNKEHNSFVIIDRHLRYVEGETKIGITAKESELVYPTIKAVIKEIRPLQHGMCVVRLKDIEVYKETLWD